MRRSAVLVLLLLCVAAVVLLLLQTGAGERAGSRRHDTPEDASRRAGMSAADEGVSAGEAGGVEGARARDDDPNRVPGEDLVLRGTVVRDGVFVAGATVAAMRALSTAEYSPGRWAVQAFEMPPPPIATTLTDDNGRFELRIARRTRVFLRAARKGSGSAGLFLLMPAAGDPPDVTLKLRPGGKVEGLVVDEKAAPVKGADVVLGSQDWSRPVEEIAARTGDDGRFVLEEVLDGNYRIRVTAASYPEARSWVYVPTQKFVRIEMRPAGVITGKVTDGSGQAIAGARVLISTSGWERGAAGGAASTATDEGGVYRAEIYPGSVQTAAVEHPRFGRQVAGDEGFDLPTGLVEAGKEMKYDIKLRPGVSVRGRAVYADTQAPAVGATVSLLRMSRQWRGMNEADSARTDEDGRFEFVFVTEGTYGLEAKGEKGARLANRYAQANQRATIDFFVDGESSPPEQRLELLPTGGVHGRFLGIGEPDPNQRTGVFVQVQASYVSATVDDIGTFDFANVPVMEDAVVQSNSPQAKSDPFRVEAGKVAEVTLDASKLGVTGVVEDEAGRPVARARVQICPQSILQQQLQQFVGQRGWGGSLTDDQGRFTVPPGQWAVDHWKTQKFVAFASRDGYALAIGTEAFDLPQEGSASPALRLVLRAGGTVRGRVEHAGGSPAVNVSVNVSPKQEQGAQPRDPSLPPDTRAMQSTYTDFDGRFEVKGIGDGVYVATSYHPQGKVEPRDVRAGDEGVKLVIEPALAIAGIVVTEAGRPVSGAQVSALVPKERGEQPQMGGTQANGRFRIGQLAAGTYPVEVSPNQQYYGGSTAGFEKKRVEGVVAGTEDLVITVSEGKGLRGKVEDAQGRPVPGAGVIAMAIQVEPPQQAQGVRPMPRGGQPQSQASTTTNGRGEFELKGVGAAEVELLAVAEGFTPATQRAVAGGAPVTLRLDGGAVIEGRILKSDGRPVARQWLWLQPATKEAQEKLQDWQQRGGQAWYYIGGSNMQGGMTDADGKFRFGSLLLGEYRIQVQLTDEVLPATTLRTGMPAATLRLERALTVRGRVTDAEGRPIVLQGGQQVYVSGRRGEQWFQGTTASSDGRFEVRGLPTGTVTLQVWAGNEYKPANVDVVAGTDGVSIALERNPPPPAK